MRQQLVGQPRADFQLSCDLAHMCHGQSAHHSAISDELRQRVVGLRQRREPVRNYVRILEEHFF